MKKQILQITILSVFSIITLKAQEKGNSFSLQQAIDYSLKNSPNYLNAQNDVLLAKYKKNEILGLGLPQITGSVDMKNYLTVPTTLLPNFVAPSAYAGTIDALKSAGMPVVADPAKLDQNNYAPIAAQFGTRYQTTAGISGSWLLYSSDYLFGVKASKEFVNLSSISVNRSKTETVSSVTKAYYGVLVNKERIKLLDANMTKLNKVLNDSRAYNKQGFVEQIDVERLEVSYNNLSTERQKIEQLILLSENVLKFQMGYVGKENLTLSDSLVINDKTEIDASKVDITKRPEYQLLTSQQKLNEINVKRLKFGYLPTLVAYGNLGASGMGNDLKYVGYLNNYYQTRLIGATLSLNIFDGLQRHYKIQQAKIDYKKGESSLKNLQMATELESTSAAVNYNNAILSLQTQKRNMELAQHIYDVSQKKYEQGVGSNLEIINAQTSLKESETNYFNSVYDMLIYKTDYLKATGTLVK